MNKKKFLFKKLFTSVLFGCLVSLPFEGFWQSLIIGYFGFALFTVNYSLDKIKEELF